MKIIRIIVCILLIVGLAILSYPMVKQYLYVQEADKVINAFENETAKTRNDEKRYEELYQMMVRYNEDLFESGQKSFKDPFAYEKTSFDLLEFGFNENMIGHLKIPRMGVSVPVYLGATKANMRKGAVHLTETSMPIGGNNTNAVIAAHRGMSTAAMFRDIEWLKEGDLVIFKNFREKLTYRVVGTKVIMPYEIDEVRIRPGKDMLTLLTCHPYSAPPPRNQRYIVYCERTNEPSHSTVTGDEKTPTALDYLTAEGNKYLSLGIAFALIILLLMFFRYLFSKRKNQDV